MAQHPGTLEKTMKDPWLIGLSLLSPPLVWAFWDVQP